MTSNIIEKIYSCRGKEIYPRGGLIVPKGSMVLVKKEFITLESDNVCIPIVEKDCTGSYNLPTIYTLKELH